MPRTPVHAVLTGIAAVIALVAAAVTPAPRTARAQENAATVPVAPRDTRLIKLDAPPEGDPLLDRAQIVHADDARAIRDVAERTRAELKIPLIVVTIESMAEYAPSLATERIETFSTLLFNSWRLGDERMSTAILFLVSVRDRQARIELGEAFRGGENSTAREILDTRVIPEFKAGQFSLGVRLGVEALAAMARKEVDAVSYTPRALEERTSSFSSGGGFGKLIWIAFIAIVVVTVISLARRGTSGWGWLGWGALFAGIGGLIYASRRRRPMFGGFGGGGGGSSTGSSFGRSSGRTFGGGFSLGGGASGRW
jgi:uncharacterized protein